MRRLLFNRSILRENHGGIQRNSTERSRDGSCCFVAAHSILYKVNAIIRVAPTMSPYSHLITALSPSASPIEAVKTHWREYLMEATELGVLMFSTCLFGTLFYGHASPLEHFALSRTCRAALMGFAVATTTFLIIRSPFGRRTGAHFNPAITLTYFWLGRTHRWDALGYVAAQFSGGLAGVFVARRILGFRLAAEPVQYVVTTPGTYGDFTAFVAEFLLSGLLMSVVLFSSNHRALARFSPWFVAAVTIFYYAGCASISGYSVNPARSFSSAFFAWIWWGIWIYFTAPCLGMLTAAAIYIRAMGPDKVYCAKVFHDLRSTCPFPCRISRLYDET
jgi:aquaporin Z